MSCWGEDMERAQRRDDRWFAAILVALLALGLAITVCGCPKPTPVPVNPTPDADAGFMPHGNVSCDQACTAIKAQCSGINFCPCSSVTDPNYASCLLDASKQPNPCQAATACDTGK